MQRVLLLITRVHHFGSNILGLVFFSLWIATILTGQQSIDAGMPVVGIGLIVLGLIAVVAIDLRWRFGADPRYSMWRFVLPGSGGSLLFIPIWLQLTAPIVAFAIVAVVFGRP